MCGAPFAMVVAEGGRFIFEEVGFSVFCCRCSDWDCAKNVSVEAVNNTEQEVDSTLVRAFIMDRRAELSRGGYNILSGLADETFSPEQVQKAANMEVRFPGMATNAVGVCILYAS